MIGEAQGAATAEVVILPSPAGFPESLTYSIPEGLAGRVEVGTPVHVPLGGRELLGYVIGPGRPAAGADRLRPILSLPREDSAFDDCMVELLRFVAGRYYCTLGEAMPLAVPERHAAEVQACCVLLEWDGSLPERIGVLLRQTLLAVHAALTAAGGRLSREELTARVPAANLGDALSRARREGWLREEYLLLPPRVTEKRVRALRFCRQEGRELPAHLGPRQRSVLAYMEALGDRLVPRSEVSRAVGVGPDSLDRLVERGLLTEEMLPVRRAPQGLSLEAVRPPELLPDQVTGVEAVGEAMRRGQGDAVLLHGVTGSGKTEIYLRAIEAARALGRPALLLVPEISLTAQVSAAVRRRLGDRVAILHSALTDGEHFDEWERVRKGEADVVVGPRSSLFAPLRRPAVIILDEEHDSSYKQSGVSPRYHCRDVAAERARLSGGCVVLGSATPAVETYYAARQGQIRLVELPERVAGRPLPAVDIVDLRTDRKAAASPLSGLLQERLRECLARGEQAILFLNRRGFSAFLLCRDCGYVPRCTSCSVSLTLHSSGGRRLLCHHCRHERPAQAGCERCLGHRVRQFGLGTERVEEAVRELLPGVRVGRLDRDTVARKDQHTRIVQGMIDREIDVLVGTQMVTKGFDFPHVTLVGVVAADVALNVPDFRAAERTFQLLTQVAGRAGRAERPGSVVVQTFNPDHPSVRLAAVHDYQAFYSVEIVERERSGYPPFGVLARVVSSQAEEAEARDRLDAALDLMRRPAHVAGVRLLGPAPCPLARVRDRYRFHFQCRARSREALAALLSPTWSEVRQKVGGLQLDVDPVDLL